MLCPVIISVLRALDATAPSTAHLPFGRHSGSCGALAPGILHAAQQFPQRFHRLFLKLLLRYACARQRISIMSSTYEVNIYMHERTAIQATVMTVSA